MKEWKEIKMTVEEFLIKIMENRPPYEFKGFELWDVIVDENDNTARDVYEYHFDASPEY